MKPKTRKQLVSEESVEAKPRSQGSEPVNIGDEAKKTVRDAWNQTLAGTGKSFSEQLLGNYNEDEQQLVEGQELVLNTRKRTEKLQATSEHMNYFRTVERADATGETKVEMEVKRGVEEIRMEIRRLVKTSKIVERTVKDAVAEKAPVRPGKYHLSFFEFVLGVIRDATRKLEDTVHFGAVFSSKKQQSTYWNRYKKHGTQFGLSGERTTATQTG